MSYYSLDAYDVIHKAGSKFEKDPRVYGGFVQGGHPALFSITFVLTLKNDLVLKERNRREG